MIPSPAARPRAGPLPSARHSASEGPATTGTLADEVLRTLLLVAVAAAGILVLLPAALGAVATRVLGAA
jgi:hypothetical protein